MVIQQRKRNLRAPPSAKALPPDYNEFVKWVNELRVSRGVKTTIIYGTRKAFSMGLTSVEDVKALPKETRGWKSMKYGMAKYEEFRAQKEEEANSASTIPE